MGASAESKLTRERIIEEAIQLLETEGLGALSMRRLAASLGIRAPTLYWYFADKSALLSGMMEELFGQCLDNMGPCANWQEWMRAFGRSIWRVQDEAPQAALLIISTDFGELPFQRTLERIQHELRAFERPLDELIEIQSAVQALMTGWSTFAHAHYAGRLKQVFHLEEVVQHSLDALIRGWER